MKNYTNLSADWARQHHIAQRKKYRASESTQVQENRIESNDAHRLERIAVHDVAGDDGIPHLNARRD